MCALTFIVTVMNSGVRIVKKINAIKTDFKNLIGKIKK